MSKNVTVRDKVIGIRVNKQEEDRLNFLSMYYNIEKTDLIRTLINSEYYNVNSQIELEKINSRNWGE